jgi:hypothetical protein
MNYFSEEFLNNLLFCINASVHIKDVNTSKYTDSNATNSKVFNLTPKDIVGLTVWDLDSMMGDNWDRDFIPKVIKIEQNVVNSKKCISHQQAFLTLHGTIRLQNMIKIPMFGNKQKVERIFTISENLISKIPLDQVWGLYEKFYANDIKSGIKFFLIHAGVNELFREMPTPAELLVIIANVMYKQPGSKYIGNVLNLSPRTVDTHLAHIRDKLIPDKFFLFSKFQIN